MVTAASSRLQSPAQPAGQWLHAGAEAQRRLQCSSYPAHRRLRCSFRAGVLIVQGRVPSYYVRQLALALVADLDGVDQFVDRLEVVPPT